MVRGDSSEFQHRAAAAPRVSAEVGGCWLIAGRGRGGLGAWWLLRYDEMWTSSAAKPRVVWLRYRSAGLQLAVVSLATYLGLLSD